jgi:hypothetical protein
MLYLQTPTENECETAPNSTTEKSDELYCAYIIYIIVTGLQATFLF